MKWKVLPKKSDDLTKQLLINRGIKNRKEAERFFSPKISHFEKDLKIPGIEKTIKRINQAIEKNELIVVFGDYDVDGVCASAILYKALTSMGAKVLPYIPHRDKEGYGLSKMGLEFARDSGASIVITVDNGIVAFEQAKFAKELGLDLIITDHHIPVDKLPAAFSIIHSTKMCGAAVAWSLIHKIVKKELAFELLQFVAIATICDLIPLTQINRSFVFEGLKVLNRTANLGLMALINESGVRLGSIGAYEIGHILGPRINAIGRLEHAIDALRLLCTKDALKARNLAKLLCQINEERQKLTIQAIEEARLQIDKNKKIHILISEQWSSGIIGLIAGRIAEEYMRPTIAISINEEFAKGSARSVDGVNIVELIRKQASLLLDIGGHPGAAGFSISSKKITLFKSQLEEITVDLPDIVEKVLLIDAVISAEDLSKTLAQQLTDFEPFGFGNPRPVFMTENMKVSDIRTVGNGKHLKFKADNIDAIAFGMGELAVSIKNNDLINLAYLLEIDNYNGADKLQLKVKDIKLG